MDGRGGSQLGAVVLVEVQQIGQVLEVVGIDVTGVQCLVGQNVIGEFDMKMFEAAVNYFKK